MIDTDNDLHLLPQIKNNFGVTGDRCLDNVQNSFDIEKTKKDGFCLTSSSPLQG